MQLRHASKKNTQLRCCRAIKYLKERNFVKGGQQVAIVQSGREPIWRSASTHAIQVRMSLALCLQMRAWQWCSLHASHMTSPQVAPRA